MPEKPWPMYQGVPPGIPILGEKIKPQPVVDAPAERGVTIEVEIPKGYICKTIAGGQEFYSEMASPDVGHFLIPDGYSKSGGIIQRFRVLVFMNIPITSFRCPPPLWWNDRNTANG